MMKFKKILMLGYTEGNLGTEHWKRIGGLCQELVLLPKDSPEIQKHLVECDCLLLRLGMGADKKLIDHTPKLKYIGMFGTGVGMIDVKYAAKKGIAVCNLYYATEAVAELTVGVILEQLRELERAKAQVRGGNYSEDTYFNTSEIQGKAFGVIGLGRVGSRIAEIAKYGFGADVRYWSRNRKRKYEAKGIRYQQVDTLLKECDFVSLNLSRIRGETEDFLNAERIAYIKPGAIVVNLAPNELVNIDALADRLSKNDITYILDHSDEFFGDQATKLGKFKNCIMYPPIGYTTRDASLRKQATFVANLENFLKGNPTNKVN